MTWRSGRWRRGSVLPLPVGFICLHLSLPLKLGSSIGLTAVALGVGVGGSHHRSPPPLSIKGFSHRWQVSGQPPGFPRGRVESVFGHHGYSRDVSWCPALSVMDAIYSKGFTHLPSSRCETTHCSGRYQNSFTERVFIE